MAVLTVVVAATMAVDAKIKVKAQFDKTFKFQGLKTYAWDPAGVGDVKILQADPARKPEALKAQWEPVILSAIDQTLASRGFTKAPIGTADLKVYYYVLIGAGLRRRRWDNSSRRFPSGAFSRLTPGRPPSRSIRKER